MLTSIRSLALAIALLTLYCSPPASADMAKIQVTSSAFAPGSAIPVQYTGEGADRSPPLAWSAPPAGTAELALICDDPDAPTPEPWVHWVAYGIPADSRGMAEGASSGSIQGKNSWGKLGYGGPMPPKGHGVHHYHFQLYALDTKLGADPGLTKDALLAKMRGHIVAEGKLTGTYERR